MRSLLSSLILVLGSSPEVVVSKAPCGNYSALMHMTIALGC